MQFNWIFVLIAGALILVFFANVINTQTKFSRSKIAATVLNDIDAISTGAEVSRGTIQVINVPNLNLGFRCTETCSCTYSLSDTQVPYGDKVMFAPDLVKGIRMLAWTNDWSMPYRVSNMVLITSPEVRYIILEDANNEDLVSDIFAELPPRLMKIDDSEELVFNKELVAKNDLPNIQDLNNYKVKIIGFDGFDLSREIPKNLQSMGDAFVTAIKISPNDRLISFYQKEGNSWSTDPTTLPFLEKSLLYAAIFAENPEMYRCGTERILHKMQFVTDVYKERTEGLLASFLSCQTPYDESLQILDDMDQTVTDILSDGLKEGDKQDFIDLNNAAYGGAGLNRKNEALQTVSSCEGMY